MRAEIPQPAAPSFLHAPFPLHPSPFPSQELSPSIQGASYIPFAMSLSLDEKQFSVLNGTA
jgi:hypothetical protein